MQSAGILTTVELSNLFNSFNTNTNQKTKKTNNSFDTNWLYYRVLNELREVFL